MPSVSQKVVIDSIVKTTLLDEKATIAQGNIVRQRDTLFLWYSEASRLIDSLLSQISVHKKESVVIRQALDESKSALTESKRQNTFLEEITEIKEEQFKAEKKLLKRQKFTWLGGGALIGITLMLLFGG